MTYDNLPDHLRIAGVAWVVADSVLWSEISDVRRRAHHWAVMRGLPAETEADHDAAAADAVTYADEHADDVREFHAFRERRRGETRQRT